MPPTPEVSPPPPADSGPLPWYHRPYLLLWLSILFSSSTQPLMKHGSDQVELAMLAADAPKWMNPLYSLSNGWIWLSIAAHLISLYGWLRALKTVPLTIAFNLAAVIQVLVPLASWLFLHEQINAERWAGILCVFAGVAVIAREVARVEEKL